MRPRQKQEALNLKKRWSKHRQTASFIRQSRTAAATFGTVLVFAVVFFALLAGRCYQQYTLSGAYRRAYEGRIVDKSQTITESQTGSGVRRRLLIEGRGGERFEVAIGEESYERAQKGMWIRKTEAGGVELSWPMTPAAVPAFERKQ